MQLRFVSPLAQNECRCYKCGKLLGKIISVDSIAVIEIKCVRPLGRGRGRCNTLNVFKIEKNIKPTERKIRLVRNNNGKKNGDSKGPQTTSDAGITGRLQRTSQVH